MSRRGSSGSSKKMIENFKDETKKVTSKGLKNIFNVIGRKIFSKVYTNEVDYGQTLSKKRRKNCILKSVSSLSGSENDRGFFIHSPYHINFQFSRDDSNFRGNVLNFQKIDLEDTCCEKCKGSLKKGDTFSRFSISSDSACDVSSESSCEDEDCKYRRSISKSKVKHKKTRSKSCGDVSRKGLNKGLSTVENFIRIHNETFKSGVDDPVCDFLTISENFQNALIEWTEEDPQPLVSKSEDPKSVEDSDYDILVTRSGYRVLEPSYENLKLVENFYETPNRKELTEDCPDPEKPKEMIQCSKTYDEVIESLKLWHLSSRYPEEGRNCSCCAEKVDNNLNHCLENYETLENDFNNDIEEFCC